MIAYLVLGLTGLAGLLLIGRWFVQADPKQLAAIVRWSALVLGALFVIFVMISGRWNWLPAALIALLPWIHRMRMLSTMRKNVSGPTPGQSSEVETRFFHMALNHDTGAMDGEVVAGAFAGRRLGELGLPQLLALLGECGGDEQSRQLLEAYLDRVHGAEWREAAAPAGADSGMSADEAREILGVGNDASNDEVEDAYRRLMLKMHPDQGGSDWFAAKINRAREVLLRR